MHPSTYLLPLTLVFFHYPPQTSSDWTAECEKYAVSCICKWTSGKRSADCQKSNMESLPTLSTEIQILDMSHNKLSQLQDNAFTKASLINLQKLYLKSCRITKIHELAFNNLRILNDVDLSFNEIEFIDPIIFQTNVRIRVIKLNNNKLHTVREFPVLEYLNTLDLSYNLLSNFTYHTFIGLRNLKSLDLNYNQFTNLNPEIFPPLTSLGLRGNNWICDCELKELRDYVLRSSYAVEGLKCSEPLSLYGTLWDSFDELSCKPEILHILANGKVVDSIVALENTLVLSCVVKGEPLPDVKWVKNGRVVQDALMSVVERERTVMLNLTVGRNDNEFVCVGSNSGGVVERNLTVTVDEAGLSGFVVLKDGVDNGGIIGFRGERGSLVVYLVIGVVFLSLVVGLIVGGLVVWRCGKAREGGEGDTVVKGVIKDEGGGATKVTDERGDMVVMTAGRGQGGVPFAEQVPLLTLKNHTSADDLLDTDRYVNGRPTPDLLISNSTPQGEEEEEEEVYSPGKFPQDNTSLYDNYDLLYNKPLLVGQDALRRYAFLRGQNGSSGYGGSLHRPSSVCSEGGRGRGGSEGRGEGGGGGGGSDTVILPMGYVTLPRKPKDRRKQAVGPVIGGVIKYDNLGVRTTADGSSNFSLNKCGVDPSDPQQLDPSSLPHYSNIQQLQEDLYDQLNAVQSPQQPDYITSPLKLPQFDPIPEVPNDDLEEEDLAPPPQEEKKKYRPPPNPKPKPLPNPKPKKKKPPPVATETEEDTNVGLNVDDDGTEV